MKKRVLCLSLLFLILTCFGLEVQIGEGNVDNQKVPLTPLYCYSMSQTIYYQGSIDVEDQMIESLAYNYVGASNLNTNWAEDNIRVYLGHTNKTGFDSNDDWIPIDQLSLVYDGPALFIEYAWCEIPFTTPFPYNNEDHLVVAIEANTEGFVEANYNFRSTLDNSYFTRCLHHYSDVTNANFHHPPTGEMIDYIPNIKLNFTEAYETPQLFTYPASFSWENIMLEGYIEPLTVNVKNFGFTNLDIEDIYLTGDNFFSFNDTIQFPFDISSEDLYLTVDFIPQTEGNFSSELTIVLSNNENKTVTLVGNALDGKIYEDTYWLNFNDAVPGSLPPFWNTYINSTDMKTNISISNFSHYNLQALLFEQKSDINSEIILFSPPIDNLANKRVRFIAKSDELTNILIIGTANKNHGDFVFTPRATLDFSCSYEEYYHSFSDLANSDEYIAFKYETTKIKQVLTTDDFYIETISDYPLLDLDKTRFFYPSETYKYFCGPAPLNRSSVTYLKIRNSGFADLTLNFNASPDNFQITEEQIIIPPQEKRMIELLFSPTELATISGTLTISSNDQNNPEIVAVITGEGVAANPTNVATTGNYHANLFYTYRQFSYEQNIYYPGEIALNSAMIEVLALEMQGETTETIEHVQILMGYTDKYYFENKTDWIDYNELLEVYNGSYAHGTSPGWKDIVLTTPFPYDENQNLVVAFYYELNSNTINPLWHCAVDYNFTRTIVRSEQSPGNIDITSPGTAGELNTVTNNLRLKFAPVSNYSSLIVHPFNHQFEDVEANQTSAELFITIREMGLAGSQISNQPSIIGGDADQFTITTDEYQYPFTLPYNETINYGISFTPTSEGFKEASIRVIGNPISDALLIPLSGTALASTDNFDSDVSPLTTFLGSNYPNPFNPETTISFVLKDAGDVKLEIYNIIGQKVKTLVNEHREAGTHSVVWKGTDDNHRHVSSGVYLYKMRNGKFSSTKKMILMK